MPYSGSIQIVNDANGTAYAFLADNGLIWQCVWNAEAERWDKALPVPGAEGGRDLQALVVDDLWPTSGVSGKQQGSSSEVMASFGAWGSDGSLGWSEVVSLSNQQGNDEAFALVNSGNGSLQVVVQKRERETSASDLLLRLQEAPSELLSKELDQLASGTRPDNDLYVREAQIIPEGGGYALQLSGKNVAGDRATAITALSPATAPGSVAQPALPFSGNAQLSLAALTANAVSATTCLGDQVGMGATTDGSAVPPSEIPMSFSSIPEVEEELQRTGSVIVQPRKLNQSASKRQVGSMFR